MKAIVLKSVFVMAFGAMSFTTVHAEPQGTFIYGEDEHTLLVSTLNQDGKTLTPCIKYEYKRNTNGAITEKKAYRWDQYCQQWQPAYLLTVEDGPSTTILTYVEWNRKKKSFTENEQQYIYYSDSNNTLLAVTVTTQETQFTYTTF
ncbi:DUF3836 domain-containing protein [Phocaeicola sp. KGMB11183]|uniref:DUF3836 domain-containing protein n=1 Tax=Phocaeicola acetigenes TaxID=3016083 RepID=A0ABT4PGV7_9BACT|nr:DUF3836 domain-containing protein [Phocaeicola sp. KGMB11183]MCZ8372274.1 DUF3836 domain-containing protein [Phocaeicola sp. KGMB11183]